MTGKLFLCQLLVGSLFAHSVDPGENSLGIRTETLAEGRFVVSWEVFTDVQKIYFNITAETLGYVGLGISPQGGMTDADMIMAGVNPDGSHYITDTFGVGSTAPVTDTKQDWVLISASETENCTHVRMERLLNTCDLQDVVIGKDTTHLIWAMSQSDGPSFHRRDRGSVAVNMLDPPMSPLNTSNWETWKMTWEMKMPSQKTTYWCSVHKSPALDDTHHIVGFRPILETEDEIKHIHHFIVHKCKADESAEAEFDPLVGQPGGECYRMPPTQEIPLLKCSQYLFVWAVGGKETIFPDNVGYPIRIGGEPDYFLFEVHYDNPNEEENITLVAGIELFYTPNLRQYNAALITSGHSTRPTIVIPPKSTDYMIIGHCSSECTRSAIPASGIKIFNVLLHSHLAGRKLKLRHFRDGKELPWLAVDNNYNFDYQQNRPMAEEITVLPGDQLTYECIYDGTYTNGSILGGMSTTEEMCNAFLWYYPDVGLEVCSSEIPRNNLMEIFGIERMALTLEDPQVLAPESKAGKKFSEVLDAIDWTDEFRNTLQEYVRYGGHINDCLIGPALDSTAKQNEGLITYPEILEPYAITDECNVKPPGSPGMASTLHPAMKISFVVLLSIVVKLL